MREQRVPVWLTKRLVFFFALLVVLVGCGGSPDAPAAEPEVVEEGEGVVVEATPAAEEPADETGEVTAEESVSVAADGEIGDEEAQALMADLVGQDGQAFMEATNRILEANDQRFNAVFIELLRAAQIGLVGVPQSQVAIALEMLSGQDLGNNWYEWIEWYGGTEFDAPPGFTTWKGELLSGVDPRFGEFLQSDYPSRIRTEEIQWGGVIVDGIPALDQPGMLTAEEALYLNPEDAVFGLTINGESRAYPLRIIDWHEMANDTVGGVPVSIAYCTLCGAAIAYDGRASDGNTYDFGSGFLFRSNKLMYDRQTRTLWNQLTGEPVLGELAATDVTLDYFPIVLTTWEDWQRQHPETLVLDVETGFDRVYSPGAAYADYFASDQLMFPVWQRSDLLEDKAQVYTLRINDMPKAYDIDALTRELVVNDTLGGTDLVLVATRDEVNVSGQSLRMNRERAYTAGAEVRAYERGELEFGATNRPNVIVDENGEVWQVTEEALVGPNGETLPRLSGHLAYWFGWYAFYPETELYRP